MFNVQKMFTWEVLSQVVCVVVVNRYAQIVEVRIGLEIVGQIIGHIDYVVDPVSKKREKLKVENEEK